MDNANMVGYVVNIIILIIGLIIVAGIILRLYRNYILSEKSVEAKVIDKQTYDQQRSANNV